MVVINARNSLEQTVWGPHNLFIEGIFIRRNLRRVQVRLNSIYSPLSWTSQHNSRDIGFSTGSSLMPQKKNPDSLELIRGKSGTIFGLVGLCEVIQIRLSFCTSFLLFVSFCFSIVASWWHWKDYQARTTKTYRKTKQQCFSRTTRSSTWSE